MAGCAITYLEVNRKAHDAYRYLTVNVLQVSLFALTELTIVARWDSMFRSRVFLCFCADSSLYNYLSTNAIKSQDQCPNLEPLTFFEPPRQAEGES